MTAIDFYYPFDSIDGDRKVTAATERRFWAALFSDGVVGMGGFPLSVTGEGVFSIGAGVALVGGCVGGISTAKSITAQPAPGATVYIVLRADTSSAARSVSLEVVESAQTATPDQLEQGGAADLVLYSVTGQTGGGYGVLDQRAYCTSFDNAQYAPRFETESAALFDELTARIDAVASQYAAAAAEINTETAGLYGSAGRQGFINPDCSVNQRGASVYEITSGTAYTFDRWQARIGGAAARALSVARVNNDGHRGLYANFGGFVDGTGSAAACIAQNIENGVATFGGGRKFTVSFDVMADMPCVVAVEPTQYVETGGTGTAIQAQTVNVSTEWQRVSMTFDSPFVSGAGMTNAKNVLKIAFFFAWRGYSERFGADQTGANVVSFANMQINEGSAALPCYVKPYADELESCQRYYVRLGMVSLSCGAQTTTAKQVITSPLPITRRLYRFPDVRFTDRADVAGKASAEVIGAGWRNGLACVLSSNSVDAPVFVVTNTDAAAVSRVCFNGVEIDAEIND